MVLERMDEGIDDRIGIGAAASALGVSVDTLRRWERAGKAHFERDEAGRRTLPAAELARMLERAQPSVQRDVSELARLGVLELDRKTVKGQKREVVVPRYEWDAFEVIV